MAYLKDPMKPRTGEQIGAGFFVFRRGDDTGRIRPGNWPFEHPTFESAVEEAIRLSELQPGHTFDVVAGAACVHGAQTAAAVAASQIDAMGGTLQ